MRSQTTELSKSQRYRLKDLEAYREAKAAYARSPEQRAKRTAYMRVWRENNRERHNELARESHNRNKHKHVAKRREHWLKKKYGITQQRYQELLSVWAGACWICKESKRRSLQVDHDHATGKVRGLLCIKCNTALGWFEKYSSRIHKYVDTVW